MDEKIETGMIALLPSNFEWCKAEFPHLTLVYLGDVTNVKDSIRMNLAKQVASMSMLSNPLYLKSNGIEVMGGQDSENPEVEVLRFSPSPELLSMRSFFEDWDSSEFPVYKPHVTLGPIGTTTDWNSQSMPMPIAVLFNRISVQWGDSILTFWLRQI